MAMTLDLSVTIDAPPGRVFALTTDIDRYGEWMPGLVKVERLTEGETAVGTRFREVRKMFGKEASEEFEVKRLDAPTRLDLFVDGTKGSSKRGAYHFTHAFEPVDGGASTRLTLHGRIEGMGCVGAVFGFLFKGMFRKAMRKDFQALKSWIEAQPATEA